MSADKLFSWLPPPHLDRTRAHYSRLLKVLAIRNGSLVIARIYPHDVGLSIVLFVCDRFLRQTVRNCDTNRSDPAPSMQIHLRISMRVYA